MRMRHVFLIAVAVALVGACDYIGGGNLPGIRVDVPVYPQATIGKTTRKIAQGLPSGATYKVHCVKIQTDASAQAVLEFYKGSLPRIRIEDLGAYFSVSHHPEGWKEGDRIEIQISKSTDLAEPGYEVRQYRRK